MVEQILHYIFLENAQYEIIEFQIFQKNFYLKNVNQQIVNISKKNENHFHLI